MIENIFILNLVILLLYFSKNKKLYEIFYIKEFTFYFVGLKSNLKLSNFTMNPSIQITPKPLTCAACRA